MQRLDQVAAAKTEIKDVRPGMRLARELGVKVHVVTIGDASQITWNEREWRSLSEVVRAITGSARFLPSMLCGSIPKALQNDVLAPMTVKSSAKRSRGAFDDAMSASDRRVAASVDGMGATFMARALEEPALSG